MIKQGNEVCLEQPNPRGISLLRSCRLPHKQFPLSSDGRKPERVPPRAGQKPQTANGSPRATREARSPLGNPPLTPPALPGQRQRSSSDSSHGRKALAAWEALSCPRRPRRSSRLPHTLRATHPHQGPPPHPTWCLWPRSSSVAKSNLGNSLSGTTLFDPILSLRAHAEATTERGIHHPYLTSTHKELQRVLPLHPSCLLRIHSEQADPRFRSAVNRPPRFLSSWDPLWPERQKK